MNQKTAITITLAIILALICALLIFKTNEKTSPQNENLNKEPSQVILQDEEKNKENTEKHVNSINDSNKINQSKKDIAKTIPVEKQRIIESPSNENIIHEASVVEEVPDYGIAKDSNGNIIITKEFGKKSAIKYSFRDFGTIDKISTK